MSMSLLEIAVVFVGLYFLITTAITPSNSYSSTYTDAPYFHRLITYQHSLLLVVKLSVFGLHT